MRPFEIREAAKLVRAYDRQTRKAKAREHVKKVDPAKKNRGRERDPGFLAYLRRQPCSVAGPDCSGPIQAAHLRYGDAAHGRVNPGLQCKPSDKWCSSLCAGHHAEQHAFGNERAWWNSHGLDGSEVAIAHYAAFRSQK